MKFHRTVDVARGKWRGILQHLGIPAEALTGLHGPCPICGGKDRFRFDDRNGDGDFICNVCGSNDGMTLACRFTGLPFKDMAARIDQILGMTPQDEPRSPAPQASHDVSDLCRKLWNSAAPILPGDIADRYLTSRGLGMSTYPKRLRLAANLWDGGGGQHPGLLAVVSAPSAETGTLHRTFLKPDGSGKADMTAPRKLLRGVFPKGGAVKLADWTCGPLGIAEGIETALSASRLFDLPVWAAISAPNMVNWQPPEGCTEILIFGDNDRNGVGQRAAEALRDRLRQDGRSVEVRIPESPGEDWNDVLLANLAFRQSA